MKTCGVHRTWHQRAPRRGRARRTSVSSILTTLVLGSAFLAKTEAWTSVGVW